MVVLAVAEFINAKCFGCGRVIRVPALAGGRNAKCPGCGQIFTIPKPADSSLELVGDDQLPEVARGEEILDGKTVPEKSHPLRATPESTRRRRVTTRDSGTRHVLPPVKSHAPLAIGGAIGGAILIVGLILVLRKRLQEPEPKPEPVSFRKEKPTDSDAEAVLARCAEYRKVFAQGRQTEIIGFYAVDEKDRPGLRAAITALLEAEVEYLDVVAEGAVINGSEATVEFVCTHASRKGKEANKRIVWKWRLLDGQWKLAEKPTP